MTVKNYQESPQVFIDVCQKNKKKNTYVSYLAED